MLETALKLATKTSYLQVTATQLAAACGTTRVTIHTRFGAREQLQAAIVRAAFERGCQPVMAQAVACNHPLAKGWALTIRPTASGQRAASCSTEVDL